VGIIDRPFRNRSSVLLITGFLAISLWPTLRVALLHFTLIGGLASIAFVVATRVILGHSGQLHRLQNRNRWLTTSLTLMLLAMATRVSGDFWPKIMTSHYIYGALAWITAAILWSAYLLPLVRHTDPD
ncbi:MAG: NnrS family protein, partial [Limisphaerales bacterium]